MKKLPLLFLLFLIGMLCKSCGPSPCDCGAEFNYARQYPLAYIDGSNKDKIDDCMELYYEEKGVTPIEDYSIADYTSAYYYFGNHPCHND